MTSKPRIWAVPIYHYDRNRKHLDFLIKRDGSDTADDKLVAIRADIANRQIPEGYVPAAIFFERGYNTSKHKESLRDMFSLMGGFTIVSDKMKRLLEQFDLGDSQFFKVDLLDADKVTKRGGEWYLLNLVSRKDTIVPEECELLTRKVSPYDPDNVSMSFDYVVRESDFPKATIAVSSSALEGADFWQEPLMKHTRFFSDRLWQSIKGSDVKIASFKPTKSKIV